MLPTESHIARAYAYIGESASMRPSDVTDGIVGSGVTIECIDSSLQ